MVDHTALDERIVGAIRRGHSSFTAILNKVNDNVTPTNPAYVGHRRIDQRLQALRKKGRILWTGSASRSGWKLPQERPA